MQTVTLDFLNDSWNEFLTVFQEEYIRDVYTENRRHAISGVRQQKLKDEPDQDLSYAYISADTTFDAMPDELYILLVSENENEVYAHECSFDTILVTGTNNCQTAHCGRGKSHFIFGGLASPIVPYRNLTQTTDGITADCRSLV